MAEESEEWLLSQTPRSLRSDIHELLIVSKFPNLSEL